MTRSYQHISTVDPGSVAVSFIRVRQRSSAAAHMLEANVGNYGDRVRTLPSRLGKHAGGPRRAAVARTSANGSPGRSDEGLPRRRELCLAIFKLSLVVCYAEDGDLGGDGICGPMKIGVVSEK